MSKDNGGPVFPAIRGEQAQGPCCYWSGLTIRDWFAGQALTGLLAKGRDDEDLREDIVDDAYDFADLIMIAREAALAQHKSKEADQ